LFPNGLNIGTIVEIATPGAGAASTRWPASADVPRFQGDKWVPEFEALGCIERCKRTPAQSGRLRGRCYFDGGLSRRFTSVAA
jgi:hypothetical protein